MDAPAVRDELLRYEAALATRGPSGIEGGRDGPHRRGARRVRRGGRGWTARSSREVLDVPAGDPVDPVLVLVTVVGQDGAARPD